MGHLPEGADHRSGYCSSNGVYYSKRPPVCVNPDIRDLLTFLFAPQFGDRVALIDAVTGRSVTYRELERNVCALAAGLHSVVGVRQEDVVVLLSPNSLEFPVIFLAVAWLGAVVTTLSPLNTALELHKQMSDAGTKYIFTTAELLEKVASAYLSTVVVGSVESVRRFSSNTTYCYSDVLRTSQHSNIPRPQCKPSDTIAVFFSSGTTGMSKGVPLTHRNYISALAAYNSCVGENLTRTLVVLPMLHVFGLFCTMFALARGMSLVVLAKFDIVAMVTAIQKYEVTHMSVVPPMVKALVNLDREVHRFDLISLVQVACGAAPLGVETLGAFAKRFPTVKLFQVYGMTEATACITALPDGDDDHVGSSGMLLPV